MKTVYILPGPIVIVASILFYCLLVVDTPGRAAESRDPVFLNLSDIIDTVHGGGTGIWVGCLVMNRNPDNKKPAMDFLDFLNEPENAVEKVYNRILPQQVDE